LENLLPKDTVFLRGTFCVSKLAAGFIIGGWSLWRSDSRRRLRLPGVPLSEWGEYRM